MNYVFIVTTEKMSLQIIFIVLVSINLVASQARCKSSEVVILIDTSQTISNKSFTQAKQLAKGIVNVLSPSNEEDGARAAVVTYSSNASKRIYCNEHNSSSKMNELIDKLTRNDGTFTNTEQGLLKAEEILKEKGCGERGPGHMQIIVLINDGRANRGTTEQGLYDTAKRIRDKNIHITAIGVGDSALEQLEQIAGNSSRVFYHDEVDEELLAEVLPVIRKEACIQAGIPGSVLPGSVLPGSVLPGSVLCKCEVDKDLHSYTKFTKYEIIRNFNGTCYVDKLKQALVSVNQKIIKIMNKTEEFRKCKQQLSNEITVNPTDEFARYDNCTININCKLAKLRIQLQIKKVDIQTEIKMEKSGFGNLEVTGYLNYFKTFFDDK